MSKYTSKPVVINTPVEAAFERLSDFSAYQERLDEMPDEIRQRIGDVRFTTDSIVITAAPVGEMAFEVIERVKPSLVTLQAKNSPVPMALSISLTADGDESTRVEASIDVDIPAVLRPMVGGKMQEAADKFAELISTFFRGDAAKG